MRTTGHIRTARFTSGSARITLVCFAAIWVLSLGFGLLKLQEYTTTPAVGSAAPALWPESSKLSRRSDRVTVVMLAHPQCPCTRASLGELAIAAAQAPGRFDINVVFLESPAFELESDLWRSAREIPNTRVIADPDGVEIAKFGVNASGHTLAYSADGRLMFSGGVVRARGHSGDSAGRAAIVELARTGVSRVTTAPVFGCSLQTRKWIASAK